MNVKTIKFKNRTISIFKAGKIHWNYEDGCMLKGLWDIYIAHKDEEALRKIKEYLDIFIDEEGNIAGYDINEYNLDNISAGRILFRMYKLTSDKKYMLAANKLLLQLKSHPTTKSGCFYHKMIYKNQIWLDGIYMAQPFLAESILFGAIKEESEIINTLDTIKRHFEIVKKYMYDESLGLYYHGFDETKSIFWADKETGCSKNFWLRSIGWYFMALTDVLECLLKIEKRDIFNESITKKVSSLKVYLTEQFDNLAASVLKYSGKNISLYQLPDKPDYPGNYIETSGNLMVSYGFMKGNSLGILSDTYEKAGREIFEKMCEEKLVDNVLKDTCKMAGLGPENRLNRDGSESYYLSEPTADDDRKGCGVWLMAYSCYRSSDD